ncbi:HEPN domain-containing protein [Fusibacter sp. 3D3]|uniref:HEPN domain-containing protein n=1 Tax=Fusibacter sp. 3D3 TaxID=1048380 RepID=UPI001FA77F08|nr:HEPN domain-containing protein [Fusibacter sp. 3D3]
MCGQCQQICEKFLKHLIYLFCSDNKDAESALRSHSLIKLNSVLKDSGIDLELDRKSLSIVKDYYFTARYPGDEFIELTRSDYIEAKLLTDEIYEKVTHYLQQKGYCLECGFPKSDCLCR